MSWILSHRRLDQIPLSTRHIHIYTVSKLHQFLLEVQYLHCFLQLAGLLQTCSWWSVWVTGTGTRYSPCQGAAGASGWGLGPWAWWQRCRSAPAGCLWTEEWGDCVPTGSGCARVECFRGEQRERERERLFSTLVYHNQAVASDTAHVPSFIMAHLLAGAGGTFIHG